MSKKNTRNALDTSLSYAVIGLDLAKADCAVAAVPCSDDDLGLIDRMDYESLFEQAEKLKPTLFAMEPCCGYSQISLRLQNMGHEVKVISGHAVKNWIATHKSNQKTDLNDATALAKLALYDHDLQPIRVKNVEECRIASVQAIRIQLRTQATKSLVCFKSLCQCWGIVIRRGSLNTKKMAEAVAAVEKLLGAEVASSLMILRDAYKFTMKQINALDKLLDALVEANEQARTMKTVLGIGTQTAARLAVTTGDIKRFPMPRSYPKHHYRTFRNAKPQQARRSEASEQQRPGKSFPPRRQSSPIFHHPRRSYDLHAVLQGHAAGMSVAAVASRTNQAWKAVRQNHRFTCSQTAADCLGFAHLRGKIRQSQSGRTTLGACGYGKAP
jgi:transposase